MRWWCRWLHIRWRRDPRARIWRRWISPRSNGIIVWGGWTTMGSGRGRVLRSGRVEPGVLKVRRSLILWRDRTFWGHEGLGDDIGSRSVGIDRGQGTARGLINWSSRLGTVRLPVATPRSKTILVIIDSVVDLPVEGKEPFQLQRVQFSDRDAANFGPRFVLESVVVKELASEQKRNREEARHLATAGRVHARRGKHAHPRSQIVETQKDGRAWQTGRGQDLEDIFPKLRRNGRSWVDASRQVNICQVDFGCVQSIHSLGHFSHEVGHLFHLIIQMGRNTSGCLLLLGWFGMRHGILTVMRWDGTLHGW